MRNTWNSTRCRRLSALALALALLLMPAAVAEDLASDLGGGFQAAAPQGEAQVIQADMENADVVIGYEHTTINNGCTCP